MRNMTRLISAGALSIPMLLGAAGLAMADPDVSYESGTHVAGPEGAGFEAVHSGAGDDYAYYVEELGWAGEDGAFGEETGAASFHDFAYFWESTEYATEDGAYSEHTDSSVEGDD